MIKLTDIRMTYGSRLVLDIPNLSIKTGEHCAVLGANGSGKTTLLRLIAGTLNPTAGAVSIETQSRGYMPQYPYIFDFSVRKNVTMALPRGPRAEAAAGRALAAVGMDGFAGAKGRSLSGGEAQRVAVARVIALPRQLLILDEPTSSTDIAAGDLVESALLSYAGETGCTLLFSTHAPAQATRLAARVILLHEGRVVEDGPAEKVMQSPESKEGRDFLRHWKI